MSQEDLHSKALSVMHEAGFYPSHLECDGKIHPFKVSPHETKKKGWYVAFEKQDRLYLVFNDWRRGASPYKFVIYSDDQIQTSREAYHDHQRELRRLQAQAEAQQKIRHETAALEADRLWRQGLLSADHPYLRSKGLEGTFGARTLGRFLLVPMRDSDDKLWAVQKITPEGSKFFLPGSRKKACFATIGEIEENERMLFVCEGFATGASLHLITGGCPVIVAFDAGNLKPVAAAINAKFPKAVVILAADHDPTGIQKALAAYKVVRGPSHVLIPKFEELPKYGSDFNDLMQVIGLEAALNQMREMLRALGWTLPTGKKVEGNSCPIVER